MTEIELSKVKFLTYPDGSLINPRGVVRDTTDLQATMDVVGQDTDIEVFWRDGFYWVTKGHRRVTAARAMGWKTIRATIVAPLDDVEALAAMLADFVREDIAPTQLGVALATLLEDPRWSLERAAALRGLTPQKAELYLSLASAPESVRQRIDSGDLAISSWERLRDKPRAVQEQVAAMDNPTVRAVKNALYKKKDEGVSGVFDTTLATLDDDNAVLPELKSAALRVMSEWDSLSDSERLRVRAELDRLSRFVNAQEVTHA